MKGMSWLYAVRYYLKNFTSLEGIFCSFITMLTHRHSMFKISQHNVKNKKGPMETIEVEEIKIEE